MTMVEGARALELAVKHSALRVVDDWGSGYAATYGLLRFIVSVMVEQDGKRWLHASVSRADKNLPTYEDLKSLKRLCIGEHRTALQVFPPQNKHVNTGGNLFGVEILHLWSCLDGDVTPDFTRGNGTL